MDKLSDYLSRELNDRGWSERELARRAGISHAQVAGVIGHRKNAGADFCIAVARALGDDPETLLRMAGILPPAPAAVSEEREIVNLFRTLTSQLRQLALSTLRTWNGHQRTVVAESPRAYSAEPNPHTLSEHLAYRIATELETRHPDDQQAVIELMERLQESRRERPRPQLETDS